MEKSMKEIKGNIFEVEADAICCPTNGIVKQNGELVMGAGLAKQFAERYLWLPKRLGREVSEQGNVVAVCQVDTTTGEPDVVSFPTKHHWKFPSDLDLIKKSAKALVQWTDHFGWKKVVLPRVGCGLGQLDWETQVKPVLEEILDDRFYVITPQ